jgi:hypothetical protein
MIPGRLVCAAVAVVANVIAIAMGIAAIGRIPTRREGFAVVPRAETLRWVARAGMLAGD